jgi:hypothetical protein
VNHPSLRKYKRHGNKNNQKVKKKGQKTETAKKHVKKEATKQETTKNKKNSWGSEL